VSPVPVPNEILGDEFLHRLRSLATLLAGLLHLVDRPMSLPRASDRLKMVLGNLTRLTGVNSRLTSLYRRRHRSPRVKDLRHVVASLRELGVAQHSLAREKVDSQPQQRYALQMTSIKPWWSQVRVYDTSAYECRTCCLCRTRILYT